MDPRWDEVWLGGVLALCPGPPLLARVRGRQRGPVETLGSVPCSGAARRKAGLPQGPRSPLFGDAQVRAAGPLGPAPSWRTPATRGTAMGRAPPARTLGKVTVGRLAGAPDQGVLTAGLSISPQKPMHNRGARPQEHVLLGPALPTGLTSQLPGAWRWVACTPGKQLLGATRPHASPPACLGQ